MWWSWSRPSLGGISWKCPRTMAMQTAFIYLFVLVGLLPRGRPEIKYLRVPRTVNVDQMNEAILDCQYDYSTNTDDYLIVKWFLNDNQRPIYTWIPHSNTRTFHPLYEPLMDKTYKFSGESYEIYRGIRFSSLHPNLTGIYSCTVRSKWSHFEDRKPMTLYRNPDFTRFEVKPLSANEVSLECVVDKVLRPGEVRLYRIEEKHFTALDAEITLVPIPHDRLQSVTTTVRTNYSLARSSNGSESQQAQFQCAVVYPNSDVNVTRNQVMFTGNGVARGSQADRKGLALLMSTVWLLISLK